MLEKMTFEEVGCTGSCDELQILGQLDYQTTPWWIQEKSFHNSSPGIFPLQNRLQNTHQRAKLTPPKLPPKEKRRGKRRFWGIMMVDNPLGDRFWGGMRGWKDSQEAFLELLIPRVLYKYKMLRSKSKLLQYVFFNTFSSPGKIYIHYCAVFRIILGRFVLFTGSILRGPTWGPSSQTTRLPHRWKFPASPNHGAPGRSFFLLLMVFDGLMAPCFGILPTDLP